MIAFQYNLVWVIIKRGFQINSKGRRRLLKENTKKVDSETRTSRAFRFDSSPWGRRRQERRVTPSDNDPLRQESAWGSVAALSFAARTNKIYEMTRARISQGNLDSSLLGFLLLRE